LATVGPGGAGFWSYHIAGPLSSASRYAGAFAPDLTHAAVSANADRVLIAGRDGRLSLLYGGPGFLVQTWEDQRKNFVEAVAMERFLMALILSLILVVAEFFIFAIVTTIVNERRRDIGILKAVGFTQGQICQAFLAVGLAVGVAGAALGVAGGYAFADNINTIRAFVKAAVGFDPFPPTIYYFKDIPTEITWISILATAGGAIVCSLIFSIIPALRAARLDPVQTLHYE
jgi:lipoprotein-releasing system permease protein